LDEIITRFFQRYRRRM